MLWNLSLERFGGIFPKMVKIKAKFGQKTISQLINKFFSPDYFVYWLGSGLILFTTAFLQKDLNLKTFFEQYKILIFPWLIVLILWLGFLIYEWGGSRLVLKLRKYIVDLFFVCLFLVAYYLIVFPLTLEKAYGLILLVVFYIFKYEWIVEQAKWFILHRERQSLRKKKRRGHLNKNKSID